MLRYASFIGFGLILGLLIQSIRRRSLPLSATWILWLIASIGIFQESPTTIIFISVALLPRLATFHLHQIFNVGVQLPRELVNLLPIVITSILAMLEIPYGLWILAFATIWELAMHTRNIGSCYRQKGISLFTNAGPRIQFLNASVVAMLLAVICAYSVPSGLVVILILYGVAGHFYLGKDSAMEPFPIEKYAKSDLQASEKASVATKLDEEAKGDYLLQGDASLSGLAKRLNTSTHHLSQVLNETRQQTFFGLLASVRINAARKLLTDPKHQHEKIEVIANKVGYASKSAFNTAFKKITGVTPSEYRDRGVRSDKVERSPAREKPQLVSMVDTFDLSLITSAMLINFFKVYYRNLRRNKLFAAINIFGLTLSIASCLMIFVYLQHELSYDRFHDKAEDIHRVVWMTSNPQTRTPHPLAQAMARDFSEVEAGVSITPIYGAGLTLQSIYIRNAENDRLFKEPDAFLADSTFFDVFDFKLLIGNEDEVLRNIGDIVITERLARKYFDDENPLGKFIEVVEYDFKGVIVGVMEDPPTNSHFHPQILISYVTAKSADPESFWWTWGDFGHFNYLKLKTGTNATELESRIPDWLTNYIELTEDQVLDMKSRRNFAALQPITDIHLHSKLRWELEANSSIIFIQILGASIVFLIVIACVNFINLSSARALERVKEMGIRRTLGSDKAGILRQFIAESCITSLIALVLGYFLSTVLFGDFLQILGKDMDIVELFSPTAIAFSLGLVLLIGLISGFYPAFSILHIKPVETLKGKFTNQRKGVGLRKGLIALQFLVSAVMIFGSMVVLGQIQYMQEKELGFDQEQVMVFELHAQSEVDKAESIKNEIRKISGVKAVGGISNIPAGQFNQNIIFAAATPLDVVDCSELRVDYDALQVLGIQLNAGRWFDKSMGQDSLGASFIVNQAAADQLNLDNLFDEKIIWNEEVAPREGKIVGVVQNFHYKSLHRAIQPIAINILPGQINYLLIRIESGTSLPPLIAELEKVHAQFDKELAFDYSFLDEDVAAQYEADRKALNVFNIFTLLALILSGMGLLGLAYLVITQRTREIGIRKVVGARVRDILFMENVAFLKIVAVSLVIGIPLGFWLMQQWLQAFAYREASHLIPIIASSGLLILIAVSTVTFAVLRTVLINPSQALRYE